MRISDWSSDVCSSDLWGYDGVSLFAPSRAYGRPEDLRALVDRAHALRLGLILDVVYNHSGPDCAYHSQFCQQYFTGRPQKIGRASSSERVCQYGYISEVTLSLKLTIQKNSIKH